MKTKKWMLALTLCALMLLLSACGALVPSGKIVLDPESGGGTAAFTMSVPKNAVENVGNNFVVLNEEGKNTNMGYITSPEAALALFQGVIPEGFTAEMTEVVTLKNKTDEFGDEVEEDVGSFDYTISFVFESAEDYQKKMDALIPEAVWQETLKALETDVIGGLQYEAGKVASLDSRVLEALCRWAYSVYTSDTTGAVIDGGNGFDYQYVHNMDKGTITLVSGEQEETQPYAISKPEVHLELTAP